MDMTERSSERDTRRGSRARRCATLVALLSAVPWFATQAQSGVLLVLSKGELTLNVVDPTTRAVLGSVPSGRDPHEVEASADGKLAFISNYGGGGDHTITIVDLVRKQPSSTVDLGALTGPHGLMFVGGKLWFSAEGAKVVGRLDPATRQVDLVLGTGQNRTHMVHASNDGKRIITTNVNSATISIIEQRAGVGPGNTPRVDWDATVVPVGKGAEGFDVSPDGREAWVANAQDGTISVVDLASKRVVQTLAADVAGANRLKFTPDGSLVFVSSLRSPDVTVLNAASRAVVKRIPVGRGAAGIQMQPDGARVYVACTPDDHVAVIDVKSLAVVGRISAGRQPDGLAWAVIP